MNKSERFEHIFHTFYPKVKGFAYTILRSEQDAEDLAQDVFVKLWDMSELWDESALSSYLYSMTKNSAFNQIKHEKVKYKYEEYILSRDKSLNLQETTSKIYAREKELLAKMMVDKMPEQRRKIFLLSRKEQLSNEEIAKKLKISIRTVEHHIYLALKDLKKIFVLFILLSSNF